MEPVEIETVQGSFTLDVGDDNCNRAFLWLFNMTQAELVKSAMNAEMVTSRLVKYSGSDRRTARSFVSAVADIAQGKRPVNGWGTWAGQYAKKFAAEKCKRDIKRYFLMFIGGLIASLSIGLSHSQAEMGSVLEIVLLVFSLVTIYGFYQACLFSLDLFRFRGGAWPEQ